MAELHDLSTAELGRAYAKGELSPVDVTKAVLAHMARCEPQLQATWALDAEAALVKNYATGPRDEHTLTPDELHALKFAMLHRATGLRIIALSLIVSSAAPFMVGVTSTR